MNDLSEQMRAAVAEPPPTGIDLDALVGREERRSRNLRWSGGAAAVAGLVLAIGLVPVTLGGRSGGVGIAEGPGAGQRLPNVCATPGPNPTAAAAQESPSPPANPPTEVCGDAIVRLAAVLTAALDQVAPQLEVTPQDPSVVIWVERYLEYEARFTVTDGRSSGFLSVTLRAADPLEPSPAAESCGNWAGGCTSETLPDGARAEIVDLPEAYQTQLYATRPDGTGISLNVSLPNHQGAPSPAPGTPRLLTMDQLRQLATTPGLTLYP